MSEHIQDNKETKEEIKTILGGLDINEFPNICSLSYEEKLPLIDKIQEKMIKFKCNAIKIITMYEDTLGRYGNYFSKAYMARVNRMILNYKLCYAKNNINKKKFPLVISLEPREVVRLTDSIGKEYPEKKITKIISILEKKLFNENNKS